MRSDDAGLAESAAEFPSVDDVKPAEEGGPTARIGFSYQDEVAVGLVLEMLAKPSITKIHCETHDDMIVVSIEDNPEDGTPLFIAEYVQIKGGGAETLYSVANLCSREDKKPGSSLYETSLGRDRHREASRFRLITNRPVKSELEILTYPLGAPGREVDGERFRALLDDIGGRMPGVTSAKGNAGKYWCSNCLWEVRAEVHNVRDANLRSILQLAHNDGWKIVYEQAEELLTELLARMKAAGEARWEPDRAKKIILRRELVAWWNRRRQELIEGVSNTAGGKLSTKLSDIGSEDSQIAMAVDLRRRYGAAVRTSRYMEDGQLERLQLLVQSKMATLRSAYVAGEIDPSGQAFHALCLKEIDQIAQNEIVDGTDAAGFLKGCMYDIADRCLHRFSRPIR
ncbi:conserved hypothetical protein [Bosea sp. 62]|uniref:dsDNA nuclease domain-containing protein n=1 Tax=unclassified Bosea (in: a-proteobacteria) TaxID=2653178 RepID=UPI0012594841|nr:MULTISPECIES: dsDNA nuclease domain-containing protein [unclassified Bosea (in: a-proteobacteria)]CAD5260995.1 conserved hypothetical protein [Bosea sp. 7B]CAD5271562.1 conserved hypothetical protein [Bosea sp. 21B]CAD5273741.1 conserved hypothetical protein [Bosea sp. 46]VVT56195.1 conserved hypothetical protein [Bosea sp. EC-HK365B]VXB63483.1 conserved hypothetical protein [Bosea sp. 62]